MPSSGWASNWSNVGRGVFRRISTTRPVIPTTALIAPSIGLKRFSLFAAIARFRLAATSCPVTSRPSGHFIRWIRNTMLRPSSVTIQLSASAGSIWPLASKATRPIAVSRIRTLREGSSNSRSGSPSLGAAPITLMSMRLGSSAGVQAAAIKAKIPIAMVRKVGLEPALP